LHDNINNNNVHPDNLVVSVPANSQTQTQKKLMWSSPMEMMMLNLYAEEVSKGQKANSGFQTYSHRHVPQELRKHFPEVEHVLDSNKVKSKLMVFISPSDGSIADFVMCSVILEQKQTPNNHKVGQD
ncbi:uncharacterized protein VP01_5331g1, partial [Puccinia sorghi]